MKKHPGEMVTKEYPVEEQDYLLTKKVQSSSAHNKAQKQGKFTSASGYSGKSECSRCGYASHRTPKDCPAMENLVQSATNQTIFGLSVELICPLNKLVIDNGGQIKTLLDPKQTDNNRELISLTVTMLNSPIKMRNTFLNVATVSKMLI